MRESVIIFKNILTDSDVLLELNCNYALIFISVLLGRFSEVTLSL